jgi:hypothetical protein
MKVAKGLKWKVSFAVLLLSTVIFIAYAASSAETQKLLIVPGEYVGVKPVELDSPPEPSTYVVLNYSYKSDINEQDLVHVLENYDHYAEWWAQQYREGKIDEETYNMSLEAGESGRITEKMKNELFNVTWDKFPQYIFWQPENRWFKITCDCQLDVNSEEYPFKGAHSVSVTFGGITLSTGWIGWVALFARRRSSFKKEN